MVYITYINYLTIHNWKNWKELKCPSIGNRFGYSHRHIVSKRDKTVVFIGIKRYLRHIMQFLKGRFQDRIYSVSQHLICIISNQQNYRHEEEIICGQSNTMTRYLKRYILLWKNIWNNISNYLCWFEKWAERRPLL